MAGSTEKFSCKNGRRERGVLYLYFRKYNSHEELTNNYVFSDDMCLLLKQHESREEKNCTQSQIHPNALGLEEGVRMEWFSFLHTGAGYDSIFRVRDFHEIRENYNRTITQA